MWNFFKKEQKKSNKKKTGYKKKSPKKTAESKKNKLETLTDPLDILDKSLGQKLKELEHNKKLKVKAKESETIQKQKPVIVKAHIDKPAPINFTQKKEHTSKSKTIKQIQPDLKVDNEVENGRVKGQNINLSVIKTLFDQISNDFDSGFIYGSLIDLNRDAVIYTFLDDSYAISELNDFIKQTLSLAKVDLEKERYFLVDLEQDKILFLMVFKHHYFVLLFSAKDLVLGQVLNILKPELIKKYHLSLNEI